MNRTQYRRSLLSWLRSYIFATALCFTPFGLAYGDYPTTVLPTTGALEYYGTSSAFLCKLSGSPTGSSKEAIANVSMELFDVPPEIWSGPQGMFEPGSS